MISIGHCIHPFYLAVNGRGIANGYLGIHAYGNFGVLHHRCRADIQLINSRITMNLFEVEVLHNSIL